MAMRFPQMAFVETPAADPPSKSPTGNYFPADAATVQFLNYNNANSGNYQLLPSGPYKNKGSDGKDLVWTLRRSNPRHRCLLNREPTLISWLSLQVGHFFAP